MTPIEFAKFAAQVADEKKATRIHVLDLRKCSDICECQMICSGSNTRQTKAIADAIVEVAQTKYGVKPLIVEGIQNCHWILLDYGATIIHIFLDSVRDFYALEDLFPMAAFIQPS